MDHRTGFYMLLKDADNPRFSDSSTWWEMFSSYVYSPDDDVAQPEHLALKGELLEALEREKQPLDTQRISLRAVKQFYQRVECNCEDLKQINVEEMKLLIAVFSYSERCRIVDNGYLSYGCTIKEGDEVTVRIKDLQDVAGVVRYKGPVPPYDGTMFGIEILVSEIHCPRNIQPQESQPVTQLLFSNTGIPHHFLLETVEHTGGGGEA